MQQYHVYGAIRYMLFCPKAPGVDLCDPPAACEGHDVPEVVLAELPGVSGASKAPRSPYLPGFGSALQHAANLRPEALGDGVESVTLSSGDQAVTLRRPGAPGFHAD